MRHVSIVALLLLPLLMASQVLSECSKYTGEYIRENSRVTIEGFDFASDPTVKTWNCGYYESGGQATRFDVVFSKGTITFTTKPLDTGTFNVKVPRILVHVHGPNKRPIAMFESWWIDVQHGDTCSFQTGLTLAEVGGLEFYLESNPRQTLQRHGTAV